jgi:hypothetical protein
MDGYFKAFFIIKSAYLLRESDPCTALRTPSYP